jgi:hypothetical protein
MATSIFTQPFFSGDCIPITVSFFGADNTTPMDLTGQYVGITIKHNQTDADANALYKNDIAGNTTGIINFLIPGFTSSAPTLIAGTYPFDIKRWDATGCRYNAVASNLIISPSTTARQAHA